jgi:dolichyl-phosphate-mannose--protein O-mannosyl transferase
MRGDEHGRGGRLLVAFCAAFVVLGVTLRVQHVASPTAFIFDEPHFVENARNYLAGKGDWNDHPPFGKLLIAASIRLGGDTPAAFRGAALASGLCAIALAFVLGRTLFGDLVAGALCAAFVALDGMLIVYSRVALLDGVLATFGLGALYLVAGRVDVGRVLAAATLAGLALSTKLSGVALVLPLALAIAYAHPARRAAWLVLAGTAVALVVYYLQYAVGLALSGRSTTPAAVVRATVAMVEHHAGLTQWQHPLTSHWYQWPLPTRPIWMLHDRISVDQVRVMVCLANPLVWWAGWVLVPGSLARLVWLVSRDHGPVRARAARFRAEWILCAGWLGFLLPWVVSARDSYLYHYLPSHALALILLGGVSARGVRRHPAVTSLFLALAAGVALFYAPIWAQLPISDQDLAHRLWLSAWR